LTTRTHGFKGPISSLRVWAEPTVGVDGMTLSVSNLEMDIAQACNLHCFGCCHYSNYGLKGVIPFDQGREWIAAWVGRLNPRAFSLLGGEPALNPDLIRYIAFAAEVWPEAQRTVVSNGMYLHRHENLFPVLKATGTRLEVSIHSHDDPVYTARSGGPIATLKEQAAAHGVVMTTRDAKTLFHVTYRGYGPTMRPFEDEDPRRSWEVCQNKRCITLWQGRLWKCPPIAFLRLVLERHDLTGCAAWQPYLEYQGVPPTAGDAAISRVFAQTEEDICGMCPARFNLIKKTNVTDPFKFGDPLPFEVIRGPAPEKTA